MARMTVLEGAALKDMSVMALSAREYVAVFLRDMIYPGSIKCTTNYPSKYQG